MVHFKTLILIALSICSMQVMAFTDTQKIKATNSAVNVEVDSNYANTIHAPAGAEDEFGFSPEGSAIQLVLKFIDATENIPGNNSLEIMAYLFTNRDVVSAIQRARTRGIEVDMIVDWKENFQQDKSGASHRALERLLKSGVNVRMTKDYPIFHDKVMLSNGRHVLNGSFNFTAQAATKNSENVSVRWNNTRAYTIYKQHFMSRYQAGTSVTLLNLNTL